MKKRLVLCIVGSVMLLSLAGCGATTDTSSDKDIKELEQRIEELEAENEELKDKLAERDEEEKEPEIITGVPVAKEQETWADDYSIGFIDDELRTDMRKFTNIKNRDITYGDVKNIKSYNGGAYGDVSTFKYFTSLEELDIIVTEDLTDISAFENLWNLKTLKLHFCGGIKDLNALCNAKNLTTLLIEGADGLTDISTLSELTALKDVEILAENWQTFDLSVLLELENLERVYISSGYSVGGIDKDGNEFYHHVESVNLDNLQEWVDTH